MKKHFCFFAFISIFILSYAVLGQDIQFRLNCSTQSCGLSMKNQAGDTLFKTFGNGQTYIKTISSLTGSYFSVNRGNNYVFDVGNYSNRNYVSVNGALVATLLLADSIGTPTPGGDLKITPFVRLLNSGCYTGSWNQCSDIRLKKNINKIENALNKVLNLQGVTYQWKKDEYPSYKFEEGNKIGLIAQDVEKTFPELVRTETDGMKSVNYANLSPVLIEAIKEQQGIIKDLESDAKKDEFEITELKKHIRDLEIELAAQQKILKEIKSNLEEK